MDTYKLVLDLDVINADDTDRRIFREYANDVLARVVSSAHRHGFDLLSLYLIKATDCAPSDPVEEKIC